MSKNNNINSELLEARRSLDELVDQVREKIGNPVSPQAVVAILESEGLRDVEAREMYNSTSLFDLGETVYKKLKHQLLRERVEKQKNGRFKPRERDLSNRLQDFFRYYGYGLMFTTPMFSQIIAVLFFNYSLWAWLKFNNAQATIVAVGTIAAFVVTGGFALVIGRELSHQIGLKNYSMAAKSARYLFNIGTFSLLAFWVTAYLINILVPFYPSKMIALGGIYMLLIGIWLLSSSILYALQKHFAILLSVVVGTVIVIGIMHQTTWGIYLAHWVGLVVTNLGLLSYAFYHFQLKQSDGQQKSQSMPRLEMLFHSNYNYFIYGILYFFLLFLDRIVAWSTGQNGIYIIWFNTPYELGMDWGLISLVLVVGSIEYSINSYSKMLFPLQEKLRFSQWKEFVEFFKQFYFRQAFLLFVVGVISITINYYAINSLQTYEQQVKLIEDFFQSPITTKVFWWASISYLILAFGMLHALFFFILSRPKKILHAMMAAVLVNFVTGFLCSRMIAYEYAVVGLAAGAITFSAITGYYMWQYIKNLDYYFYSAY
jgi:hypothetical protein